MKNNIFIYLLITILLSCHKDKSKSMVSKDSISNTESEYIAYSQKRERFLHKDFLSAIDSTFKTTKETSFKLKIDTLRIDDFDKKKGNLWNYLTEGSDLFIRYGFVNKNRRVNVFTIHNSEPTQNNKCFEVIASFAYNEAIDINKWPGLNYINDYVFKTNNNIYWLSTPCSVSYKNHLSLSSKLKDILIKESNIIVTKELFCKCGKVLCEK